MYNNNSIRKFGVLTQLKNYPHVGRERGGGGTSSNSRACAGVQRVIREGDGGTDGIWYSQSNLGCIIFTTDGTGESSLLCAVCTRQMLTLAYSRI